MNGCKNCIAIAQLAWKWEIEGRYLGNLRDDRAAGRVYKKCAKALREKLGIVAEDKMDEWEGEK